MYKYSFLQPRKNVRQQNINVIKINAFHKANTVMDMLTVQVVMMN